MKTLKVQLMDRVEAQGGLITWKEANKFLVEAKYNVEYDTTYRGIFASYFSGERFLMYPAKNDNRYLTKIKPGLYVLKYATSHNRPTSTNH